METEELAADYLARAAEAAPAYQRIKDVIGERAARGDLAPGEPLPSENSLVEALMLSRMTVNRAYRELASEGLVNRVRGVGTFMVDLVPPPSDPLIRVENIADRVRRRGHAHTSRVVFARREEVPEDATALRREGLRRDVFHSRLVHLENGVPIQLEDRWANPALAPDYLEQDFSRTTPNDYLTRAAPLAHGRHVVEAVLADAEEARLLEIGGDEPCLRLTRWTWSAAGLVSLAHLLYPGSRGRLEGEFGQG